MKSRADLPVFFFETQRDWEAWLEQHHVGSAGVWVKMAKKGAGIASMDYAQALEGALCYGWIDSQKAAFDERYWLLKFTPRGAKSRWSRGNCQHASRLVAEGRMRPAGLRQVTLAKEDGRWDSAYDSQSSIAVPADFQAQLDRNPTAAEFFSTLDSANRYAVLYRLQTAGAAGTRQARISRFLDMLNRKETIHPRRVGRRREAGGA